MAENASFGAPPYNLNKQIPLMNEILMISVPILFGTIHFIEYSSFFSRIAGIKTNKRLSGYSIQQAAFVFTRFFFIALMPAIGFIIDKGTAKANYLLMVHAALLTATAACLLSVAISGKIIIFNTKILNSLNPQGNLFNAIISSIKERSPTTTQSHSILRELKKIKNNKRCTSIALASCAVFTCYSIGVFVAFYAALNFYEYRSSISQLSGIVNGLATVLLTFFVEPEISKAIDNEDDLAESLVYSILLGRLLGIALLSQIIIMLLWLSA